jgi:hypothetical protein
VVKKHYLIQKHKWHYTTDNWEEEEIHYCTRTYHEVIFRRNGNPLGRISQMNKDLEMRNRGKLIKKQ